MAAQIKTVARNRKAFHDFEVLEKVEAGLELTGSEVKAARASMVNLTDSYGDCNGGQIHLVHAHIGNYQQAGLFNHDPYRKRRILLHRKQIAYLSNEVDRKGLTLIPLEFYFKNRWAKVELGLCRGRKKYDKRQKIANEENRKRLNQLMRAAKR